MRSLEGRIEEFSISEILQIVAMGQKTGTLVIEGARERVSVYFKDGKAVYADPAYKREYLGDILVKQGVVSNDDVKEALSRQRKFNELGMRVRIGSILVSMGVLTDEQLSEYVADQIKDSIYSIMAEKSGTFRFVPKLNISSYDIVTELNVEDIILEGTRLIDEWSMINEKLLDFDGVYAVNTELLEKDTTLLSANEWRVLSLLDGRRSVNDVIATSKLGRFEICKVIFNFICFDLVRKVGEGATKEST
jgi:hypothetical protein